MKKTFRINAIVVIVFITGLVNHPLAAQAKLHVTLKIHSKTSLALTGVEISCTNVKSGEKIEKISVDTLPNILDLELEQEYLIEFYHPDYYRKSFEVKTDVPRKFLNDKFKIEVEISLDQNCEQNANFSYVIYKPIGRIEFSRKKDAFDYDANFTYKMGNRYEKRKDERCRIVREQERARRKMERLAKKENDSSILAEIEAEKQRIETLQKQQETIIAQHKQEEMAEIKEAELEEKKRLAAIEAREKRYEKQEKEEALAKKRKQGPRFDEKNDQIHIFPSHGWPSELASYIKDPDNYRPKPIGTFTYDLTKNREEFYVWEAEELRQKFPEEFDKAFKNWDYIVEVNSKYIKE